MGSGKRAKEATERAASEESTTTAETRPAAHPEELRAAVEFDIAGQVTFRATARATPAGIVSIAILLAAIMVPIAWARRARRWE